MKDYLIDLCTLHGGLETIGLSRIQLYRKIVEYELEISHKLNYLYGSHLADSNILSGFFWCPKSLTRLKSNQDRTNRIFTLALRIESADSIRGDIPPPTKFISNDFINPFQEIVNTYGVPDYKEANPAVLTVVTFPFLFGVMFGDIFHGSLLLLFSLFLLLPC